MSKKILIVDDSATARALFKACLPGGSEYVVLEADNMADAVSQAISEQPFLIILDYNMPDNNGADIAREMQAKGIEAYYVLSSANTQKSIIEEINALGFTDVLEKPVDAEMIQLLLEKLT